MLPLGLPFCPRSSFHSVRTVSLTPTEISTNQILNDLVPGIIKGTINSSDCICAQDQKFNEIFDMCMLHGDYPSSPQIQNFMEHMEDAPSTHGSLQSRTWKKGPKFDYNTKNQLS